MNNDKGGKAPAKINFKFPKAFKNKGSQKAVRSTSSDFFIGGFSIQTASIRMKEPSIKKEPPIKMEESSVKKEDSLVKTQGPSIKKEPPIKMEESSVKKEDSLVKTQGPSIKTEESSVKTNDATIVIKPTEPKPALKQAVHKRTTIPQKNIPIIVPPERIAPNVYIIPLGKKKKKNPKVNQFISPEYCLKAGLSGKMPFTGPTYNTGNWRPAGPQPTYNVSETFVNSYYSENTETSQGQEPAPVNQHSVNWQPNQMQVPGPPQMVPPPNVNSPSQNIINLPNANTNTEVLGRPQAVPPPNVHIPSGNFANQPNIAIKTIPTPIIRIPHRTGIPRSFLVQQHMDMIRQKPQDAVPSNQHSLNSHTNVVTPPLPQVTSQPSSAPLESVTTQSITDANAVLMPNITIPHRTGIPRSFLVQQHMDMIRQKPQDAVPSNQHALNSHTDVVTPPLPQVTSQPSSAPLESVPTQSITDANAVVDEGEKKRRSPSPNWSQAEESRVSAFERLGPVSQPKKPKLMINLLFSKNEPVREVIDENKEEKLKESLESYTPVHERRELVLSVDELVIKHLPLWPWKRNLCSRITVRPSRDKYSMLTDFKKMSGFYALQEAWIGVKINGYPEHYNKEMLLDTLLENLRNEIFVPCFIEFYPHSCKFLVLTKGTMKAFTMLHNMGLKYTKDDRVFSISLWYIPELKRNYLDFHPRLILAKRVTLAYNDYKKALDLGRFCLQPDISHFIYFPLNRVANQCELFELPTSINWDKLRELCLSRNRLTTIEGFNLHVNTPNLRVLDLSFNYLERITALTQCHGMALHSLRLEGNPLCTDFTDPDEYVKVARMLFPCLKLLDGVPLLRSGDVPTKIRNYCPEDAKELVDAFLGIYFPLLDADPEERIALEDMYAEKAVWSLTFPASMRLHSAYRCCKELFQRYRNFIHGNTDSLTTGEQIARHLTTWPVLQHDYYSFNVDVLYHTDTDTIVTVNGVLKVTAESLNKEEPVIGFVRTLVLHTDNGSRYRIQNEMVSWDWPSLEIAVAAFRRAPVLQKKISLKLDYPPDDKLKNKLIEMFMDVSELSSGQSKRCLERNNWHFKNALEHFMELVKLDDLKSLSDPDDIHYQDL